MGTSKLPFDLLVVILFLYTDNTAVWVKILPPAYKIPHGNSKEQVCLSENLKKKKVSALLNRKTPEAGA